MAFTALAATMLAALVWQWTRPAKTRACTLAAAVSNPVAATPEGAVDAWWAQRGPADAEYWSSQGPMAAHGLQATRDDFKPIRDTEWEWRYSDIGSVGVAVGRAPGTASGWTVTAVNRCGYGTT